MSKKTRVVVTVKKDVLDPAGVAIKKELVRQGLVDIADVRVGKVIDITFRHNGDPQKHLSLIKAVSHNLLSNPVVEDFALISDDE